jgi:RNA polymerase sigma-70 factor (ECF subfamily)
MLGFKNALMPPLIGCYRESAKDDAQAPEKSDFAAVPVSRQQVASDRDLIESCIAEDEGAFRILYQRYVGKVRSTLYRLAGASHLDDMTQETFMNVWRHLKALRGRESASAWIYRIAVNVAVDHLRANKRRATVPLAFDPISTRDEAYAFECRQLAQVSLEILEFAHRSVLVLHDLEQLTENEIAEILGIPSGTVKSRLFTARQKVRAFLSKQGVAL